MKKDYPAPDLPSTNFIQPDPNGIIRVRTMARLAGNVHSSTVWRWRQQPDFPTIYKLSPGVVGCRYSDFLTWLRKRAVTK
jgi:predicted DNA-binding transcriptional regulator AlpA